MDHFFQHSNVLYCIFFLHCSPPLILFFSCHFCSFYRCWRPVDEVKGQFRGRQKGKEGADRSVADTAKRILHCLITGRPLPACWLSLPHHHHQPRTPPYLSLFFVSISLFPHIQTRDLNTPQTKHSCHTQTIDHAFVHTLQNRSSLPFSIFFTDTRTHMYMILFHYVSLFIYFF